MSKLVTFYLKNVRNHPKHEMLGIYRNIQRMVEKGKITMTEMSAAVQNYSKDEWVRSNPPARRHHIRTFFTLEKLKEWVEPPTRKPVDPTLAALDKLAEAGWKPEATPPAPIDTPREDDDEWREI